MKTDLRDYSKAMDSEEGTDPLVLLKSLSPMLDLKGGIEGANEATKIVGLMRTSKILVSRCIFLSILKVTSEEEVLEKFIGDGGWKILNKWLSEAKDSENIAIILEILKLLQRLPLRIQHLRENNTPKIVKHYAKSSDPKVKSAASSLMNSWMAIIRGSSTETETVKKKKEKKKAKSVPQPEKLKSGDQSKEKNNFVPTLKTPSFAKFRKTGLETEQPLKKKIKVKSATSGKRSSVDNDKESPVPEKKVKPNLEVKQKKITISEGFMDALNSASNPVPIAPKKIKRKPVKPLTSSSSAASAAANSVPSGDANDFSATELLKKLSPKGSESPPTPAEPVKPKLNKYGKPKKTVQWHAEEFLESIRYFEVDETERVNVSTQCFKDAQHREMMIERQLLKGKMPLAHEGDQGELWKKPVPFDNLETLVVPGCNSVEKDIQTEREKTVLMEIFLTKDMVPDSPAEPDPEPYEIMQPKIIPFEDENSIVEAMEPEVAEQENGSTGDDIIMKNMLSGIQQQNPDGDLTAKLKQILETASAITNSTNDKQAPEGTDNPNQQMVQGQMMPQDQNAMWVNGMPPPGGQPMMNMPNMDMNGPNGPMGPPMGFFPGPMMVPMNDPNYFGPNWVGHPPPHNGPPHLNGPPGPSMGPLIQNGPGGPRYGGNNFNQGWNRPKWGPRNGPNRPEFRGGWRGRWNDNRRR